MKLDLIGNIIITGGTGSLGTAIVDRAVREGWNARFTVLARNESKMADFIRRHPQVRGEIGDVRDLNWLRTVMPGHDVCIHAAAIKQVPTAESNVREAILTNVVGSQNVAMACVEAGVSRVIGISTDKACAPTTTYGGTKYLMEGLFREAHGWSRNTHFVVVRYGNVLRSNASVVPLFEHQIEENVPFTVTHLGMTRFWLTMDQAIDLVLAAFDRFGEDKAGVVLVPKPPAMKMVDLAHALDPEREIVEIGIRAGEKVHEFLINGSESVHTRTEGEYFVIYPPQNKVEDALGSGYEYTSRLPSHWIEPAELYVMLDSYNPYGGRKWVG